MWSTKNREPLLHNDIRPRVWAYLAGIAQKHRIFVRDIGGVADHVHLFLDIPKTLTVTEAAKTLKGVSSTWINEQCFIQGRFQWQDGYGAFTVGPEEKEILSAYIRNQEEHHRVRTFAEEYEAMLRKHGIDFDPRYHLG
ncbi:MAG: IS200/IS605 family transposase [Verrucomicrobia bacterium]|nr:IS200/IS605 family transposase [Verrucomicrobiota bacterium]MCH8526558.1 IS200/IS605 family transposase [Kiritimatiellia bacterium]